MSIDLWPPDDYPTITRVEPDVTGCTVDSWTTEIATLEAADPAEAATTSRTIRPLHVKGQGGWLRWSVTVTPLAGVVLDNVGIQILFTDDDDAQVGRWTGPVWDGVAAGMVLSARQPVPRLATQAQLKVLSLSDTASGQWTEYDTRLDQIPADPRYTPPPRDLDFADMSPEGVMPPPPPAGLPGAEANSPARRSPQVRWAQVNDSIRPDLTVKRNARDI